MGIEGAAKRIRQISLCKVLICFLRRRDKPPSEPTDTVKTLSTPQFTDKQKQIIQTAVNKTLHPRIVKMGRAQYCC